MATFSQLLSEPKHSSAPPPRPHPQHHSCSEAALHHSNASFPCPSSSLFQLQLLQPEIPQLPAPQQPPRALGAAPPPPHLVWVREISSTVQLLVQPQSPPFAFQIGFPPPLITCNESSDAQVAASYFSDHLADNRLPISHPLGERGTKCNSLVLEI